MVSHTVRGLAALVVCSVLASPAFSDVTDAAKGVPASLVFDAGTSLSLQARNISNNQAADTVTFGPITAGQAHTLANQYIEIAYSSNYSNYKITTYTDNGYSDGTNFYGALIGSDTTRKAAIKWLVADDTSGALPFDASTADTWTWYKDKGDPDWVTASGGGYTTVTYGSGGGFNNLANGLPAASPIVQYVGAMTSGIVPDNYKSTIRFDLVHL